MKTNPERVKKVPRSTRDIEKLNEISVLRYTLQMLEQQLYTATRMIEKLEDEY